MRTSGSIRLGLPRPTGTRPAECGWSERPDRGLHRPARLGRGLHPRGRLVGWMPPPHCLPVRATFRWLPHPIQRPQLRSPGQPSRRRQRWNSPTPYAVHSRTHEPPCPIRRLRSTTCSGWGGGRRHLQAVGLELTMGGEPTFVSTDDMTSAQWTVAADGPEKRQLANRLAAGAGRAFRTRRTGATQRGQVVSRRTAAALADRTDLAE